MLAFDRSFSVVAAVLIGAAAFAADARGAVVGDLATPPGASATIKVTLTVTTSLGTSSDDDTKTVAVTGVAGSAFAPNAPAFDAMQLNSMTLNFATTTFTFNLYCIPIFGCQQLHVTVSNLQFDLAQPACTSIAGNGAVSFIDAQMHTTGDYSATGVATGIGSIDGVADADFTGRVTNPSPTSVRLDQLNLQPQTFIVRPEDLPSGVTYLSITVEPNLANTTLEGPFAISKNDFDADGDGTFDFCDICTDSDGDGFGDPGFPMNLCDIDNCPDVFNPDQLDSNGNGIGDACETIPCPADVTNDGNIDVSDLLMVINNWGAVGGNPADVTGDGMVDVADLLAVINAWGACP